MNTSDQNKSYSSKLLELSKYNLTCCGYQQITVDDTAAHLTIPTNAKYAICIVESDATGVAVRFLELNDKTLPTDTTGMPRADADSFDISGAENLKNFRVIQAQSGAHLLNVSYYK